MEDNLLKLYSRDLVLKGYSPKTRDAYYRCLVKFLEYTAVKPEDITREMIKDYLYYLINDRKLSVSFLQQARSSICYFFSQTLAKPLEVENIPCQKRTKKLPVVLSVEEVFRIIKAAGNLKHRTMIMLCYSSGLRVSELVALKISDIYRNIMRIAVRQAKGGKGRYTILSSLCLSYLEKYWMEYHPVEWLFNGMKKGMPMTIRAVQDAYNKAKQEAGINKKGGIHILRHSFATHMLETGGSIFQLQKFLGHKYIESTLIYAHVKEENIIARSPLDVYRRRFLYESV